MGGCVLVSRLAQPPGSSTLGTRIPDRYIGDRHTQHTAPPGRPSYVIAFFTMCLILNLASHPRQRKQQARGQAAWSLDPAGGAGGG